MLFLLFACYGAVGLRDLGLRAGQAAASRRAPAPPPPAPRRADGRVRLPALTKALYIRASCIARTRPSHLRSFRQPPAGRPAAARPRAHKLLPHILVVSVRARRNPPGMKHIRAARAAAGRAAHDRRRPSWLKSKLIIFDTTMRDGEQSPGASMTQGREAAHRAPARAHARRRDRSGIPGRERRRFRRGAGGRAHHQGQHRVRARARERERRAPLRRGGAGARARRACTPSSRLRPSTWRRSCAWSPRR